MAYDDEVDYVQRNSDANLNNHERRVSKNIVVWDCPTNRHYRIYRTRKILTQQEYGDSVERGLFSGIGEKKPSELCVRLSEISGTESVRLNGFECSVVKAGAFDWSEIEPDVVLVLESAFVEVSA